MKNWSHCLNYYLVTLILLFSCSAPKSDKTPATTEVPMPSIRIFEEVNPEIRTQLKGFLADYFSLNQMLIMDDQKGAKEIAGKFSDRIKKFEIAKLSAEQMDFYYIQVATLTQGLKSISETTDIDKARLELVSVSESVYALAKAYHPNDSAIYYQYCPMARNGEGANWLNSTKEIANPYMGQMMPECGRTQETLH